jgi:exosortase/archaeosortase family protein
VRNANKYFLKAVATGFSLFGLLRLPWVETHVVLPVTRLQGDVAASAFGVSAAPISVTLACSGTEVIAMCLGAVLAYPVRWSARALGAFVILAIILGLNTIRIGTLGMAVTDPYWFDTLHLYLWPALLTLASAGAVFGWIRYADRTTHTTTTSTTTKIPIAPSWRFVSLALVLLLVSALTAPLYLDSAVVQDFGALIATTTARLLNAVGAAVTTTGNILWTSRGGFSVTGDCVATPLVPLYLAAVWVYVPAWWHKMLGTIAAVPIFLLLGVLRLLLVAVPQTMAPPEVATHAFYQVVLAVVLVVVAGRWQHGIRVAAVPIAVGVVAGTLFVLIAGGMYTDLVLLPADRPFLDPQGAVAFLPSFQIGLFLAAGIAAVRHVRWSLVVAGAMVLFAGHIAGAWLLNVSGVTALLAAHVALVRAWAVAAPLLILAALVAHAHARR